MTMLALCWHGLKVNGSRRPVEHRSGADSLRTVAVWGDQGCAMEELVVELGSAFLTSDLSLTPDVMPDHVLHHVMDQRLQGRQAQMPSLELHAATLRPRMSQGDAIRVYS